MVDLNRAVEALVDAAKRGEIQPRALKGTVESVLDAFDAAPDTARNKALRALGRALALVEGQGTQVLMLAIGALVESGASPEVTWPIVSDHLIDILDQAAAFANAAVKAANDENVESAVTSAGTVVAKRMPRNAAAWNAVPSRCLTAVACLTHSKKLRKRVSKDRTLHEASWPLSDVVAEVGYLLQALRTVDDETFLVLAPDAQRGWRVTVDAMPSNAELYVLLADAVLGDPKRGHLAGKRPDPRAVTAIRNGAHPAKGATSVKVPFHLVDWASVAADGTLPPANSHETAHWIWMEGIPWDIPRGPGKERVVLLQASPHSRVVPVAPSFEALRPDVKVAKSLTPDEVKRTMLRLGHAAAAHAAPSTKKASSKKAAKSSSKKTAKPSPKKVAKAGRAKV